MHCLLETFLSRQDAFHDLSAFKQHHIDALLENNLPISCPYEPSELYYNAVNDKKRMGGTITVIVPERIGKCRRLELSLTEFKELLG